MNECSKLKRVSIVNATFAYDCPYTMKAYMLIVKNTLRVELIEHNLIPLFIMQEVGLIINDVPKIYCGGELTQMSHTIISRSNELLFC